MRNYRDKYDIIADILEIAKENPKKTQIMYKANLSYKVLKKYLNEIIKASLISYIVGKKYYTLTDKGEKFLMHYKEYSKTNTIIKKRLEDIQTKKGFLKRLCYY